MGILKGYMPTFTYSLSEYSAQRDEPGLLSQSLGSGGAETTHVFLTVSK